MVLQKSMAPAHWRNAPLTTSLSPLYWSAPHRPFGSLSVHQTCALQLYLTSSFLQPREEVASLGFIDEENLGLTIRHNQGFRLMGRAWIQSLINNQDKLPSKQTSVVISSCAALGKCGEC